MRVLDVQTSAFEEPAAAGDQLDDAIGCRHIVFGGSNRFLQVCYQLAVKCSHQNLQKHDALGAVRTVQRQIDALANATVFEQKFEALPRTHTVYERNRKDAN